MFAKRVQKSVQWDKEVKKSLKSKFFSVVVFAVVAVSVGGVAGLENSTLRIKINVQ